MKDYEEKLAALQTQLTLLQHAIAREGRRAIVVFEGWDAAGKGGIIRRLAWALDPRHVTVWPIGAPDEHEKREYWMQRFMRRLPRNGRMSVFDRSWYGRVLVERIEGLCSKEAWQRAYGEINGFEQSLVLEDFHIVKLFLDITPETQLRRFRARYEEPEKRWKLSVEDLRNRARWSDYEAAYDEMLERTDTPHAHWHRIDANDKKKARIAALEVILEGLSRDLDLSPPDAPPAVDAFFAAKVK